MLHQYLLLLVVPYQLNAPPQDNASYRGCRKDPEFVVIADYIGTNVQELMSSQFKSTHVATRLCTTAMHVYMSRHNTSPSSKK
jgi:hypothetical protein